MIKPVPASAAVVGSLVEGASLSWPTRIEPRLLKSKSRRWLPALNSMGLRMKMSIEYSTMPRALTGASPMSVITAFRRSAGSSSPKAAPRSFSYCPTEPKDSPPNVGDWDRAGSMTMLRIPEPAAVGLANWVSLKSPPKAATGPSPSQFPGESAETCPNVQLEG